MQLLNLPWANSPKQWAVALPRTLLMLLTLFGMAATNSGISAFESKKNEEKIANSRRIEAELALMKSQINPHFLLNTLNNLYSLALITPEKAPDAILKLSEMVQYILHECTKAKVDLSDDIAFLKNYIELQKLRLPPNVMLHFSVPEQVPAVHIEPMILITYIENAFKHGMTTKTPCSIFIDIRYEQNSLFLEVKNPIFPKKEINNGNPSGVGLKNTAQRLLHSYPEKHQLDIQHNTGKHHVYLKINLL